ncbi:MAG TPA: hypothetical protein PLB10_04070 [Thiolinea sp.]|nr:hypothetical protein [Thiolinea sp.]
MSRNKKSGTKKTASNLPPQALEQAALQALENAQYRQALQYLKTLLKQGGDPVHTSALLQQAYTGRAEQLADQGMYKEALVTWESAQAYGLENTDRRYLDWLLKARQYRQWLSACQQLPPAEQQSLQPQLAAIILAGETALLDTLAPENPVRRDHETACELLERWCQGESQSNLQALLKRISFRSPYRDLRQIIQAWPEPGSDPEQIQLLLQRLPADSPFHPLAQQARLLQLEPRELLPQLDSLSATAHNSQMMIRGWSGPPAEWLKKIAALEPEPAPRKLYDLFSRINTNQVTPETRNWLTDALKKTWVRLTLASEHGTRYPDRQLHISRLAQLVKLPPPEKQRLFALANDAGGLALESRLPVWEQYRNDLLKTATTATAADPSRKTGSVTELAAQLNCHLVQAIREEYGELDEYAIRLLEQALEHDPSLQSAWADILEYYLQQRKLKPARDTLKQALTHHPDDTTLLELGTRIAIAGNAFKKAADHARHILAIDPINTRIRQLLRQAHTAHAGKQLKQGKLHLVAKELEEARNWKGTALDATITQVLQVCLAVRQQDLAAARQLLQALITTEPGAAVRLEFILRHESLLTDTPLATLLNLGGLEQVWKKPAVADVLALEKTLRELMEANDIKDLTKSLAGLQAPLKKAAKLKFAVGEGESLCELWLQTRQEALLTAYATRLEKTWPDKPVFTYYRFANMQYLGPVATMNRLEQAWDKARDQGDSITASRLGSLLDRLNGFDHHDYPVPPMQDILDGKFSPALDNLIENMSARELLDFISMMASDGMLARQVLEHFGEQALRELCRSMMRGDSPEDFIKRLEKGFS